MAGRLGQNTRPGGTSLVDPEEIANIDAIFFAMANYDRIQPAKIAEETGIHIHEIMKILRKYEGDIFERIYYKSQFWRPIEI
jgi:hypothetical protein